MKKLHSYVKISSRAAREMHPPLASPGRCADAVHVSGFSALHDVAHKGRGVAREEHAEGRLAVLNERLGGPASRPLDRLGSPRARRAREVDEAPRSRAKGHLALVIDPERLIEHRLSAVVEARHCALDADGMRSRKRASVCLAPLRARGLCRSARGDHPFVPARSARPRRSSRATLGPLSSNTCTSRCSRASASHTRR